jgi:cyclophilin family peptidyl-prolyl cis-trans isomerase
MPKIGLSAIIIFSSIFFFSSCTKSSETQKLTPTPSSNVNLVVSQAIASTSPNQSDIYVGLNTQNGQIVIRLNQKQAPDTVKNFLSKVNSGFYDGLTFHRVIPGFMAQGGDPKGDGTGGGRQVSELNQVPFVRGSLGLARTAETKEFSNDSQFFICYNDNGCQHLTGDYVNFGQVVTGFDILDQIKQGDKILSIFTTTK